MRHEKPEWNPSVPVWFNFVIQIIIVIGWGSYFTFLAGQNEKDIAKIYSENMPTRIEVLETKIIVYDKILKRMADMEGQLYAMGLRIERLTVLSERRQKGD